MTKEVGEILDLIERLTSLLLATSRARSEAISAAVRTLDEAVVECEVLELRLLRGLAAFDVLFRSLEKRRSSTSPLTANDVSRIVDEVYMRLADNLPPKMPPSGSEEEEDDDDDEEGDPSSGLGPAEDTQNSRTSQDPPPTGQTETEFTKRVTAASRKLEELLNPTGAAAPATESAEGPSDLGLNDNDLWGRDRR